VRSHALASVRDPKVKKTNKVLGNTFQAGKIPAKPSLHAAGLPENFANFTTRYLSRPVWGDFSEAFYRLRAENNEIGLAVV
jgi:hypothetical protein